MSRGELAALIVAIVSAIIALLAWLFSKNPKAKSSKSKKEKPKKHKLKILAILGRSFHALLLRIRNARRKIIAISIGVIVCALSCFFISYYYNHAIKELHDNIDILTHDLQEANGKLQKANSDLQRANNDLQDAKQKISEYESINSGDNKPPARQYIVKEKHVNINSTFTDDEFCLRLVPTKIYSNCIEARIIKGCDECKDSKEEKTLFVGDSYKFLAMVVISLLFSIVFHSMFVILIMVFFLCLMVIIETPKQ